MLVVVGCQCRVSLDRGPRHLLYDQGYHDPRGRSQVQRRDGRGRCGTECATGCAWSREGRRGLSV